MQDVGFNARRDCLCLGNGGLLFGTSLRKDRNILRYFEERERHLVNTDLQ